MRGICYARTGGVFARECLKAHVAAKQLSEAIKSNIKTMFWEEKTYGQQKCQTGGYGENYDV